MTLMYGATQGQYSIKINLTIHKYISYEISPNAKLSTLDWAYGMLEMDLVIAGLELVKNKLDLS